MSSFEPILSAGAAWHAGDWVEVRGIDEILATLDEHGSLDALPFMPEMIPFCGRRFQIVKVAHKTCDPTGDTNLRRMHDAVHLQTRCDGAGHGGCQAGCQFFWKMAWLRRVAGPSSAVSAPRTPTFGSLSTLETLDRATRQPATPRAAVRYRCQATEIVRATTPLSPFEPTQYIADLASRNVTPLQFIRFAAIASLKALKIAIFHIIKSLRGELSQPPAACPTASGGGNGINSADQFLHLQPGELVQIRSRGEIMPTLDSQRKNRGLNFDRDMASNCGATHRVLARVERIIDERTGRMLKISKDSIILDGVTCQGLDCHNRLFCSRGVYTFWREAWLRRVESDKKRRPAA